MDKSIFRIYMLSLIYRARVGSTFYRDFLGSDQEVLVLVAILTCWVTVMSNVMGSHSTEAA